MIKAGLADRARRKGEPFTQEHKDFAAALQVALERIATHVVMHFQRLTKARNLCLSGGVAHNCSMNGQLLQTKLFDRIHVAPAAHDAGNALGSALSVLHDTAPLAHSSEIFPHVLFGTDIGDRNSIGTRIVQWQPLVSATVVADAPATAAHLIAEGAVIGWVQGRSEFGPRALGNGSILADPLRREPAESVRTTYTRLQSSLGSIEALGQELFDIWQMRALRLLPSVTHH